MMNIHIQYTVKKLQDKPIEVLYFNPLDGHTVKIFSKYDNETSFQEEILKTLNFYKNYTFIFHRAL